MSRRSVVIFAVSASLAAFISGPVCISAQTQAASQAKVEMDASETAFLKPLPGEGNFGEKVRWIKKADAKDPNKLTADIQARQDDGSWTSMGEYLGHSDDGRMYVRSKVLTLVMYYEIQCNAPPPPPAKKKTQQDLSEGGGPGRWPRARWNPWRQRRGGRGEDRWRCVRCRHGWFAGSKSW